MSMLITALGCLLFVVCYILGGQGKKWARKWVGTAVLASSIILSSILGHSFSWFLGIACVTYLVASNSFSYGTDFTHDKFALKIVFRGLCGLMYGLSGLLVGLAMHHWFLGAVQIVLAPIASIVFGVFNPFNKVGGNKATMVEDGCISLSYITLIPFMVM